MKRYRKEDPVSYTLGATLTFYLLDRRPETVRTVYIHPQFVHSEFYPRLTERCRAQHIPVCEGEKAFRILSEKENCFVIGEFSKYEMSLSGSSDHVVLVNPSNSGNLGTVMRSCLGFGYRDIAVIRPAIDFFDPKTVRASMGALFGINIKYFDSFDLYLEQFRDGRAIYPFMLQTDRRLGSAPFASPHSLVFGNESSGLPHEFLSVGTPVIISHSSDIDSLNLPIAVSIALYEASKSKF